MYVSARRMLRVSIIPHTVDVISIGKVGNVGWTFYVYTPENASNLTFNQSWKINVSAEIALGESIDELPRVDVISIIVADRIGEIIVSIFATD